MITIYSKKLLTYLLTYGRRRQTGDHDNSATIRSNECITR